MRRPDMPAVAAASAGRMPELLHDLLGVEPTSRNAA